MSKTSKHFKNIKKAINALTNIGFQLNLIKCNQ
jgi:hypothetical protein